MSTRHARFHVRRHQGSWAAAGWYAAALLGFGIAFVCTVPLAAKWTLARSAAGFEPRSLLVERVAFSRRSGGRAVAVGRLSDGSEARLMLDRDARPTRAGPDGWRPVVRAGMELPVLANPALAGGWLHRQRVLWPEQDLRGRLLWQCGQLLAIMAGSLAVSLLAWRRLRPFRGQR
jgi:hypothetical protein